jgi:hypothetical protein
MEGTDVQPSLSHAVTDQYNVQEQHTRRGDWRGSDRVHEKVKVHNGRIAASGRLCRQDHDPASSGVMGSVAANRGRGVRILWSQNPSPPPLLVSMSIAAKQFEEKDGIFLHLKMEPPPM